MSGSLFKSKKKSFFAYLAVLIVFLWLAISQSALGQQNNRKVVMLVINSITLDDLIEAKAPKLRSIINSGAVGLVNAKAASINENANFYLSIGAGARAEAGELGGLGFNATERLPMSLFGGLLTAKDLSLQSNDLVVPNDAVVNLGINDASGKSFKYHNNIIPGLLGEALKQAGKKVAVLGNADTLQETHRDISLITMDFKGRTPFGNVSGDVNVLDKSFPGGIRTNYEELSKQASSFLKKADFVAVELGDSARLDYQRTFLTKRLSTQRRSEAILKADTFLLSLLNEVNIEKTLLIIASPKPSTDAMKDLDYLTPIVIRGLKANKGNSLLISNTTQRAGLVANIDLAPTILNYLEVDVPVEMAGNIMTAKEAKSPVKFLTKRHEQIYTMRIVRTPFVITYSLLLLAGLTLVILTTRRRFSGKDVSAKSIKALKILLLFILAVPLSSLLQIPLGKDNIAISLASGFLIAILFALVAFWAKKKPLNSLLFITTATTLVITVDALTGTILSQRSFFGSDLISGGRYYGLGNVYMGLLIGAATFSIAGLADVKVLRRYLPSIGFIGLLVVGIIVGHPRIGANVGGLITGVATALIFSQMLAKRKFSWRLFSINILVFGLLMAVILSADIPGTGDVSHTGKALAIINSKGGQAVTDIIIRKISQNVRGTSAFPGFLMLAMFLLVVSLKNWGLKTQKSLFSKFSQETPITSKAFLALVWAAIIGYAFNDTGAITAAAIASYILIPLFYLALEKKQISAG